MNKLRVVEAFAGAGAWAKGLGNLGINHEVVDAIEFDVKTMDCYNVIHGSNFGPKDITKVIAKDVPDHDVFCYSPPCQSFSIAGKGEGIDDARGTLFYNALSIIEAKQPKYCLMENVKNLTGKAHRSTFYGMLKCLEYAGYTNHWKVLNSKEHGVPQNRERVFVVSIRNDLDISYIFPNPYDNGVRLIDILEDTVDDKHYIDDTKTPRLPVNPVEIPLYDTEKIGGLWGSKQAGSAWNKYGISPTIKTPSGGYSQPIVYIDGRYRSLTSLEYFRLQGFSDFDHAKLVDAKVSDAQLYKLMGNSISVPVVTALFKALLCPPTLLDATNTKEESLYRNNVTLRTSLR